MAFEGFALYTGGVGQLLHRQAAGLFQLIQQRRVGPRIGQHAAAGRQCAGLLGAVVRHIGILQPKAGQLAAELLYLLPAGQPVFKRGGGVVGVGEGIGQLAVLLCAGRGVQ